MNLDRLLSLVSLSERYGWYYFSTDCCVCVCVCEEECEEMVSQTSKYGFMVCTLQATITYVLFFATKNVYLTINLALFISLLNRAREVRNISFCLILTFRIATFFNWMDEFWFCIIWIWHVSAQMEMWMQTVILLACRNGGAVCLTRIRQTNQFVSL